jgi:hypothetical protein
MSRTNAKIGWLRRALPLLLALPAALLLASCLPGNWRGADRCDGNGLLFADDFDGARDCGWALYSRGGAAAEIRDGALRLTASQPGQIWWTNPERMFTDTIITVRARQVSGPDDNAYGVICRYQSPENHYVFLISGDGYYAIGKYQSGSPQIQYLTGDGQYQFSDTIRQGTAVNEMRVACVGNQLTLHVNGLQLASVSDPTFVIGDIGLAAGTFQPGTAVIEFDDLRVIAP